jgi:acyl-CoA synthetase (AMP-forming)/AMP-acid ligase II
MVITCLKPEDHDRVGSCGRPFFLAEVAIFDDEDHPLPPGEKGEIVVRGPQLMARYWNRPDATEAAFRNGWLHTGDIGTMDADGFFYILDHKNDMLISGGYSVYPREVGRVARLRGRGQAAVVACPTRSGATGCLPWWRGALARSGRHSPPRQARQLQVSRHRGLARSAEEHGRQDPASRVRDRIVAREKMCAG